jgi:hypothetical protein
MQVDVMAAYYLEALDTFMQPYGDGEEGDDDDDGDDDEDDEDGEDGEEEEEGRGPGAAAFGYAAPAGPKPAVGRAAAPGGKSVQKPKRKKDTAELNKQERAEYNALKKAKGMAQVFDNRVPGGQAAHGASQGQQGVYMVTNQQDPQQSASYQPHKLKSGPAMGAQIFQPMPGQQAAHGAAQLYATQGQQGAYALYQQGQQQPASYQPVGLQMQPASCQAIESMQLGMHMGMGMPAAVPWQHRQQQQEHQQQIHRMQLLHMQEQQFQQQQQRRLLEMALHM